MHVQGFYVVSHFMWLTFLQVFCPIPLVGAQKVMIVDIVTIHVYKPYISCISSCTKKKWNKPNPTKEPVTSNKANIPFATPVCDFGT